MSGTASTARAARQRGPKRGPMPRHFARPHIGRVPMKFYFRAQDINIKLPGYDTTGKLVVVWKRGPRRTETGPIEIKEQLSNVDGSLTRTAATLQDLALICTMFKVRLGAHTLLHCSARTTRPALRAGAGDRTRRRAGSSPNRPRSPSERRTSPARSASWGR